VDLAAPSLLAAGAAAGVLELAPAVVLGAALSLSAFCSGFPEASAAAALGTSLPAVPLFLVRKSVTYQPLPLRIKAVLLTILLIGPPWQTAHPVGAGSVIFCSIS